MRNRCVHQMTPTRPCLPTLMLAVTVSLLSGCNADSVSRPHDDVGSRVVDTSSDSFHDIDLFPGDQSDRTTYDEGLSPGRACEAVCDDENLCTVDECIEGECENTPGDRIIPPQDVGNCRRELCEDGLLSSVLDDTDLPAEDEFECTVWTCRNGEVAVDLDHAYCADADRCNGDELCDVDVGCVEVAPADYDDDGIPDREDPDPPDTDEDGITDCADVETCDWLDNNGNGLVDDDPVDDTLGDLCYEGPDTTEGEGVCRAGTLQCHRGEIVCRGQVLAAEEELCDGLDNDCDGVVPAEEATADCLDDVQLSITDGNSVTIHREVEAGTCSKTWLLGQDSGDFIGYYEFDTVEAAEEYWDSRPLRMMRKRAAADSLTHEVRTVETGD